MRSWVASTIHGIAVTDASVEDHGSVIIGATLNAHGRDRALGAGVHRHPVDGRPLGHLRVAGVGAPP